MTDKITNNSESFTAALDDYNNGKLADAARKCRKILAQTVDDFDALYLLGGIVLKRGNSLRAVDLFQQAIASRSSDANAHLNLGRALYQLGKLELSVSAYRNAINIQPNFSYAIELLDSTSSEIKQIDEAIRSFEKNGCGPSIKFSKSEQDKHIPDITRINKAERLYKHFGYLIVEDLFSEKTIDKLYTDFIREYSQYFTDSVFEDARKVGDKRVMVTVKLQDSYNNPEFYANPLLMPLLARLLGRDLIYYSLGSVTSLPGAKAQQVHRDHSALFEGETLNEEAVPSFAVTVGIPLIEMNEMNGTTRVYGRTHRNDRDLTAEDIKKGISPIIKKGSCLLFDYRVMHEGTPNVSNNIRPLMYNIYTRPWFRDYKNYSKQSPMIISDEEFSKIPEMYHNLINWTRQI